MDERNEWNILSGRAIPGTRSLLQTTVVIGPGFNSMIVKGGGGGGACKRKKKKKKADEITILLWLEIIASKKIAFSRGREEMGGRKTLRAVVYFIKYSETQSFCTFVSVLLYLYFSIYVFSTLRAPTKVLCSLLWEREKERGRNREEEKGTVTTPPIRFPSATTGKRMEIGSNLLMIRDRVLEAQSPFPFRPFR